MNNFYDLAKRISINTVAQGTAAEVMKLGMISIDKALKHIHADAHMILQIHDEIILQVPIGQESIIESLVKTTLQDVVQWRVPLEVTTRIGSTWYEVSK